MPRQQFFVWTVLLLAGCGKTASLQGLDRLIEDKRAASDDAGVAGCAGEGEPCVAGLGECERVGVQVCTADGGVECEAEVGQGQAELCDSGKDEDCDGDVDEAPEGRCCSDDDCSDGQRCDRLPPEVDAFKAGECADPSSVENEVEVGQVDEDPAADEGPPEMTKPAPAPPCGGADLKGDASNCGLCGFVCEEGEACEDGRCVAQCEADLESDAANCGACGRACAAGLECVAAECVQSAEMPMMTCPAGQKTCGTACIAAASCCVDGDCATDEKCNDGQCVECTSGAQCESDELCDAGNCVPKPVPCGGSCGHAEICVDDKCQCPAGMKPCGPTCILADKCCDNDECAARDSSRPFCSQTKGCVECVNSSQCDFDCSNDGFCKDPPAPCGGADLQTDEANCGTCGKRCATGQRCMAGRCEAPAESCGGADLDSDPTNCGTCGHRCQSGDACVSGQCELNPVWLDRKTGLSWEAFPGKLRSYDSAAGHCASLKIGTQSWRVPSVGELRSLIRGCAATEINGSCGVTDNCLNGKCAGEDGYSDCNEKCPAGRGQASGCYWPGELGGNCSARFWTSSKFEGSSRLSWTVDFQDASISEYSTEFTDEGIRCVSGP